MPKSQILAVALDVAINILSLLVSCTASKTKRTYETDNSIVNPDGINRLLYA